MGLHSFEFPLVIVSTDTTVLRDISWTLSELGCRTMTSSDWSDCAPWRRLNTPALVILDARDEPQIQTTLAARPTPYVYRVALYDANMLTTPDVLTDLGADDLLRYPLKSGELTTCLRRGARRLEFERRLKDTITFDLQCGVSNCRGFTRQLERKLQDKGQQHDAALVVVSIDFLEVIRAQYGFAAVEKACTFVAESLFGDLSADNSRAILAEGVFAVLLPGQSASDGIQFAEEIACSVGDRSGGTDDFGSPLTLSGVVFDWPCGDTSETTIRRAMTALQHVQCSGGNQILDGTEIEEHYADWKQQLTLHQATVAQYVMEALPLILPISTANSSSGLGIYAFESGSLPPCVPVVDDAGQLLGVIEPKTFRELGSDIMGSLEEHLDPVSHTLNGDSRWDDITASFQAAEDNYRLVVDNNKPIGYITRETIAALEADNSDASSDRHRSTRSDCDLSSLVVPMI